MSHVRIKSIRVRCLESCGMLGKGLRVTSLLRQAPRSDLAHSVVVLTGRLRRAQGHTEAVDREQAKCLCNRLICAPLLHFWFNQSAVFHSQFKMKVEAHCIIENFNLKSYSQSYFTELFFVFAQGND